MKVLLRILLIFICISPLYAQSSTRAGTILQIAGKDIIVKNENPDAPFIIGERLKLLTGSKNTVLEVMFPMQTSSKCRILSGSPAELKPGMLIVSETYAAVVKDSGSQLTGSLPLWRLPADELGKLAEEKNINAVIETGIRFYHGRDGFAYDKKKCFNIFKSAESSGNPMTFYYIGKMSEFGYIGPRDKNKAIDYYKKAFPGLKSMSNTGYAPAQYALGVIYNDGYLEKKNTAKAIELYRKAADQNYAPAENELALKYRNGTDIAKNLNEAFRLFSKAARDFSSAQNNVGRAYLNGEGVEKNYSEAVKWFVKSAGLNNYQADYNLGYCYENGYGVIKDITAAKEWYKKAADGGNKKARESLKRLEKNST